MLEKEAKEAASGPWVLHHDEERLEGRIGQRTCVQPIACRGVAGDHSSWGREHIEGTTPNSWGLSRGSFRLTVPSTPEAFQTARDLIALSVLPTLHREENPSPLDPGLQLCSHGLQF